MSQESLDLLVQSGLLTEADLREARTLQRGKDLPLAQVLLDMGRLKELDLTRAMAKTSGLPFVDLSKGKVPNSILELIPRELALEQGVAAVAERGGRLIVAIDDPLKRIVADQLQFQLGRDVACALATKTALTKLLEQGYGAAPSAPAAAKSPEPGAEQGDDAPVVRLVNRLFADALEMRASDIHIEPAQNHLRVRFRVDGVLRPVAEHPLHLASALVSRLKIMGSMDIAEKRKPQDGRIAWNRTGRDIDVRASILPSNHGETMVMRLLDRSANLISLRELGFDNEDHRWFSKLISRPHGIVLVTGPTGSGKTTTLYAALSELNRPDVKIITAEDPVEYHISGINQVQVNPKQGLTFGRVLRAMLRSAPNIILVGEIRDLETAEVAIQAALTGHLVFSTLHTNDAPSALTRLIDMGVPRFLASAAVQGVVAQRLVRRLCGACASTYPASAGELAQLGLEAKQAGSLQFKRARGCSLCEGLGFRGRIGLFELFELNAELRDRIFHGASLEELRSLGSATGKLRGLLTDGARKVIAGETSIGEVLRVTRAATSLADEPLDETELESSPEQGGPAPQFN